MPRARAQGRSLRPEWRAEAGGLLRGHRDFDDRLAYEGFVREAVMRRNRSQTIEAMQALARVHDNFSFGIASTIFATRAKPSPVPPCLRFVLVST